MSSKAGTYILVSDSNSLPDFCLDGCVYTKDDDRLPGSNYCFKKGILNTTCRLVLCVFEIFSLFLIVEKDVELEM